MAEILRGCPGSSQLKVPTITEKVCLVCGNVIELFSIDVSVPCDKCGFVAYNDLQSCIQWCSKAEECIGTEMYNKLVKEKKDKKKKEAVA